MFHVPSHKQRELRARRQRSTVMAYSMRRNIARFHATAVRSPDYEMQPLDAPSYAPAGSTSRIGRTPITTVCILR